MKLDRLKWVPSPALTTLLMIAMIDLIATAVLHANGLITELNPIMKPLIERSEWLFALVKGSTLVLCWSVMAWHSKTNKQFVDKACWIGSAAYVSIWSIWVLAAH